MKEAVVGIQDPQAPGPGPPKFVDYPIQGRIWGPPNLE